jgi:predicted nucleic acid-binding protein
MTRIVVDGSVAAKWYFDEPGHEAADRILSSRIAGEHELLAPDLIVPEFVNVLWKRVRQLECSNAAARVILSLWENDRPALVPSSHLASQAFELARALDQTVYDCLYLALALAIEAPLATADRQLARAARSVSAQVDLIA